MRLVHAGAGRAWDVDGGFVADEHRVWRVRDGRGVPLSDVLQVWPDGEAVVAVARGRFARFTAAGVGCEAGAPGPVRLWEGDGFLFRTGGGRTQVIDVLYRGDRWSPGPHGAAAIGSAAECTRAAVPGRAARPLPVPLAWGTERWSTDGSTLVGIGPDEWRVTVDVVAGVVRDREPVAPPPSGSLAVWEGWLAGPGGRVWSLRERRPHSEEGLIPLGVVVATPEGFVAVDWETNAGFTVPFLAPRRTAPFVLPIPADDTPVAGRCVAGVAYVRTALGAVFAIRGTEVLRAEVEVPAPPPPIRLDTPLGPFHADGRFESENGWVAWNEDGWIVTG